MEKKPSKPFVLGITTSALFDMSEANMVFERLGPKAYIDYMRERADEPLQPGAGFDLASAISSIPNHTLTLISRNNPITAVRAIRTLLSHDIIPECFYFTNGRDPTPYLPVYKPDLFLSTNKEDVIKAFSMNIAAASLDHPKIPDIQAFIKKYGPKNYTEDRKSTVDLNQAFTSAAKTHWVCDEDGVIANLESELVYREKRDLAAYRVHEKVKFFEPIGTGPIFPVAKTLEEINAEYDYGQEPHMISGLTARGAVPGMRMIYAQSASWGLNMNNGEFHAISSGRSGVTKGAILKVMEEVYKIKPFLLDDSIGNIIDARESGIAAAQVHWPEPSA